MRASRAGGWRTRHEAWLVVDSRRLEGLRELSGLEPPMRRSADTWARACPEVPPARIRPVLPLPGEPREIPKRGCRTRSLRRRGDVKRPSRARSGRPTCRPGSPPRARGRRQVLPRLDDVSETSRLGHVRTRRENRRTSPSSWSGAAVGDGDQRGVAERARAKALARVVYRDLRQADAGFFRQAANGATSHARPRSARIDHLRARGPLGHVLRHEERDERPANPTTPPENSRASRLTAVAARNGSREPVELDRKHQLHREIGDEERTSVSCASLAIAMESSFYRQPGGPGIEAALERNVVSKSSN